MTKRDSGRPAKRVEIVQKSPTLASHEQTIRRQDAELAGQSASIARLEGELDASSRRAALLEAAMTKGTLALHEKQALLAWVLESTMDGVLVYRSIEDAAGAIVDFECVLHNPAAARLYGRDQLEGERLLALHPDIHDLGLWAEYTHVMETGAPFEGEFRYLSEGHSRWFRVLAIKLAVGLALTFSDITHRKEAEARLIRQFEDLKRADRVKSEFLGVVSHELRTPVNIIMGFLGILEDEIAGPLNEAQHDSVRRAIMSSEQLLALVNDLLDLRGLQAGTLVVESHATSFPAILSGVIDKLAGLGLKRPISAEVSPDTPRVEADELRTAQVLTILLGNAIKFTPPGSPITVQAKAEDGFLRCQVRDAGGGIAPGDRHKLFQAFSQVDMSTTREVGGAGLGLSLAKHLVEAQGGRIGLEDGEGRGATFWFTLPLAAEASPG